MPYRIAGVDVHKRMLAVVVADVAVESEFQFTRRMVGTSPDQLRALAAWLVDCEVEEVVMESTAQYWRPVWEALERYWQPRRRTREGAGPMSGRLHLAQPPSSAGGERRRWVRIVLSSRLTLPITGAEPTGTGSESVVFWSRHWGRPMSSGWTTGRADDPPRYGPDDIAEIITGAGPGGGPHVRV